MSLLPFFITKERVDALPLELQARIAWLIAEIVRAESATRESTPTEPRPQPAQRATNSPEAEPEVTPKRVSVQDLVRGGLLHDGQEIFCRPLRRQRRNGLHEIGGATVRAKNGSAHVEFRGGRYEHFSPLAAAMLNSHDTAGKPAEAAHGYIYLGVKQGDQLTSINELRHQLLAGSGAS